VEVWVCFSVALIAARMRWRWSHG